MPPESIALLSQEGSTIETEVDIVRGVVPKPHSLRMHCERFPWVIIQFARTDGCHNFLWGL